MRIAVLSGKGGTGKTFISVNLACSSIKESVYVDCDVEEPNGHLFFNPDVSEKNSVSVVIPEIDFNKCIKCRKCTDFCRYNALAMINDKLMIFKEVCHSCGGCIILCPQKALSEKKREIGTVETGTSENVTVISGCLHTGEVSGIPVIKKIMTKIPDNKTVIIDCPPGSACTVMESIRSADYCILAAEPTIFGAHNLAMVHDLVKIFNKPAGAILNKCLIGEENPSRKFCTDNNLKIIGEIPFDETLGDLTARGLIASRKNDKFKSFFNNLLKEIIQ
ncbi:MAG: ATP-binding protein [Endomicrobiaceae bacterium]